MTRRIMKDFRITEIAAVDRPAQAGALAVIMKRDNGDEMSESSTKADLEDSSRSSPSLMPTSTTSRRPRVTTQSCARLKAANSIRSRSPRRLSGAHRRLRHR
jgi:hypothetical protein